MVVNELYFLWQVKVFVVPPMDHETKIYEGNKGATEMANKRFSHR